MPGARDNITLTWLQDWTLTYTHGENVSLLPAEGGSPYELGMYWLQSWTAPDAIEIIDTVARGAREEGFGSTSAILR